MPYTINGLTITYEDDLVTARQRARQVATDLTFDEQDRTRISTAVSEIIRVFQQHGKTARVEFLLEGASAPQVLLIYIVEAAQGGRRPSATKASAAATDWRMALQAAGRLMDQCEVEQAKGGLTAIKLMKLLPKRAPMFSDSALERLNRRFSKRAPQNPMEEVRQQNQELLRTLEELHQRQQELLRVNQELEDTNRGVVALYAELDEKAGHLRRADEMKSTFLSNMSHEFRTPLNAILALSQLLLCHADGDLTSEQEKQVGYIRKSGEALLELVNDLLDLAKIQAGKIEVRPSEFDVANLFSALRGMLRPLLISNQVDLIFEQADGLPLLTTDEGKVSQILRNFISNAIKFTERGEVRVRAESTGDGMVSFSVADTGIGIAEEDQSRIFEDFTQIENPIQYKVKGTGLGLPLCRKLAGLLGGAVTVSSRPGVGSTFFATIPVRYRLSPKEAANLSEPEAVQEEEGRVPVLVVEDEPETRLLYENYLRGTVFQPIPAGSLIQARGQLKRHQVAAIVLDIMLPDDSAWQWLVELKSKEDTKAMPVLVVSSVDDPRKGLALGAVDYGIKPVDRDWLISRLARVTGMAAVPTVLIIDDQETDRYILRRHLYGTGYLVAEASGGMEGLKLARDLKPTLILLDLNMSDLDGFQVLAGLRDDASTADIPVAVVTSLTPLPTGDPRLAHAHTVLCKNVVSPTAIKLVMQNVVRRKVVSRDAWGGNASKTLGRSNQQGALCQDSP